MSTSHAQGHAETKAQLNTTTFPISPEESARETALRRYFADFWQTAEGQPRAIYDRFIAACPVAEDVSADSVNERGVEGWWLRPTSEGQERAILFLHGGSYVQGSAKAYRGLASQIASRTRVPVLAIDYPLAPEAVLPAALEAALTAWRWLPSAGVKKIAVVGDSAGGGLALTMLAALPHATDGVPAVAGVAFSPWVDLAFTGRSMTDPKVEDPLLSHDFLRDFAQKYLGGADPRDPSGSPLFGELTGLPPLLIQVGTDERLLDDSRQYAEKAADAGVPVRLEIWQGMHHVFQLDVARLESSRVALDRAAAFLTEAFSRG
jgi:epsilon-lactone hydrolase